MSESTSIFNQLYCLFCEFDLSSFKVKHVLSSHCNWTKQLNAKTCSSIDQTELRGNSNFEFLLSRGFVWPGLQSNVVIAEFSFLMVISALKWKKKVKSGTVFPVQYTLSNEAMSFLRFIDLDVIIAVQDQPPSTQDINNSSFNVVTPTRTYELMAHDEEEKLRYRGVYRFWF